MNRSGWLRASAMAGMVLTVSAFTSCGNDGAVIVPTAPGDVGDVFVLTASDRLVSFDRVDPGTLRTSIPITGQEFGEKFLGLDFRPADGKLYALSDKGRIYTLDRETAKATLKTTLVPNAGDAFSSLSGTAFGVDFNPVPDRMRVVSNTGQNLRINVDTGATITDGAINGGSSGSAVTGVAYTDSVAGAASTTLYDIDSGTDTLYVQAPPNNGTLTQPVTLGVDASEVNGFDIDALNNTGYAVLTVGGTPGFYKVNLGAASSAATLIGNISGNGGIKGLALVQPRADLLALSNSQILHFAVASPNTIAKTVSIKGLLPGEKVVGLDVRPANRKLHGLTSTARLFTVDPDTGDTVFGNTLGQSLNGLRFAVDFNPVADRMRVLSDSRQSLRANVDTGATTVDGALTRSGNFPVVTAAAYLNSYAGTTATKLYDIDTDSDTLNEQTPPNDGTLVSIGGLGLAVDGDAGMDIAGGGNGLVLAALRSSATGPYSLYRVNLASGAATLLGTADAARIGGAAGPEVQDLVIWLH